MSYKLGLTKNPLDTELENLSDKFESYVCLIRDYCGTEIKHGNKVKRDISIKKRHFGFINGNTDFQSEVRIVELKHAMFNENHFRQALIYTLMGIANEALVVNTLTGEIHKVFKGKIGAICSVSHCARAMSILRHKDLLFVKHQNTNRIRISFGTHTLKDGGIYVGAVAYDLDTKVVVGTYDRPHKNNDLAPLDDWLKNWRHPILISWNKVDDLKYPMKILSSHFNKELMSVVDDFFKSGTHKMCNTAYDEAVFVMALSYVQSNMN